MARRRLGVYGENLPTKRARTVQASNFQIGGIAGRFERKYNRVFEIRSPEEFQRIFGDNVIPSFYGTDAVNGFFSNIPGVDAILYVGSHVGNSGGAIDATIASRQVQNGTPADLFLVQPAYQNELEYGISGNRRGSRVTLEDRFATELAANVAAVGVTTATLDSVIGIRVGDIVRFDTTTPAYVKVTAIDESLNTITWVGDLGQAATTGDAVTVPGFTIRTFIKTVGGVESEVDTERGRTVCTTVPEVTEFYVENVFSDSTWVSVTVNQTGQTLANLLPAADSAAVFCTGGTDGTYAATAASWADTLQLFNDLPVRFLANPETSVAEVNIAGEAYCAARNDTPLWIYTLPENRSQTQLITLGQAYQRSNDVFGVIAANWLEITDPFATGPLAPPRNIPNVGHVMGLWIRVLARRGVHVIPGLKSEPLLGAIGVVGYQALSDIERTVVSDAGVNMIQQISGIGIVLRNAFTPSTDSATQFSNGVLMRNFFKVSFVDSLQDAENTPNSINRIRSNSNAMLQFFYRMWDVGSTGSVVTGETFGQTEREDGTLTQPTDHFEVRADLVNNPQSSINLGERNLDAYFTFPSPAGSIRIGVGILQL